MWYLTIYSVGFILSVVVFSILDTYREHSGDDVISAHGNVDAVICSILWVVTIPALSVVLIMRGVKWLTRKFLKRVS